MYVSLHDTKPQLKIKALLFFDMLNIPLLCIHTHIFPKAQVASNKNAHKLWHHFWAQFFMLFHMMWSILFRVLALKTLKWKFLIGCWRTSTKEKVVSWPNTPNKMNHTMWKSMKNCAQKWCCKLCAFLCKVTCAFLNRWHLFFHFDISGPKMAPLARWWSPSRTARRSSVGWWIASTRGWFRPGSSTWSCQPSS